MSGSRERLVRPEILRVRPTDGDDADPGSFDAFDWIIEQCWTPVIGPTAVLLGRRLVWWGVAHTDEPLPLDDLAAALGVKPDVCWKSLLRAIPSFLDANEEQPGLLWARERVRLPHRPMPRIVADELALRR